MDDLSNKIELTGNSGRKFTFIHCFNLSENEEPKSTGIYVFAKQANNKKGNILDVQFLAAEDNLTATVQRMKADGAGYAFFRECEDELQCDAEIDDIKAGEDFRSFVD